MSNKNYLMDISKHLEHPNGISECSNQWKSMYKQMLAKCAEQQFLEYQDLGHFKSFINYGSKATDSWLLHPSTAHSLIHNKTGKSKEKGVSSGFTDMLFLNTKYNSSEFKKYYNDKYLCVFNGFLLDLKSDFQIPPRGTHFGALQYYTNQNEVIEKLDNCFLLLYEENEEIFKFIVNSTIYLCIREERDAPSSFSSCSFSGYSGFTLLINIMQNRIDNAKLIDALYHESIHAILYFYEEVIKGLLKERPSSPTHLISPWSGKCLGLDQFVQACFVWWGLFNLWSKWTKPTKIPIERIEFFRNRARNGFLKDPYTIINESDSKEFIDQDTLESIMFMSEKFK